MHVNPHPSLIFKRRHDGSSLPACPSFPPPSLCRISVHRYTSGRIQRIIWLWTQGECDETKVEHKWKFPWFDFMFSSTYIASDTRPWLLSCGGETTPTTIFISLLLLNLGVHQGLVGRGKVFVWRNAWEAVCRWERPSRVVARERK